MRLRREVGTVLIVAEASWEGRPMAARGLCQYGARNQGNKEERTHSWRRRKCWSHWRLPASPYQASTWLSAGGKEMGVSGCRAVAMSAWEIMVRVELEAFPFLVGRKPSSHRGRLLPPTPTRSSRLLLHLQDEATSLYQSARRRQPSERFLRLETTSSGPAICHWTTATACIDSAAPIAPPEKRPPVPPALAAAPDGFISQVELSPARSRWSGRTDGKVCLPLLLVLAGLGHRLGEVVRNSGGKSKRERESIELANNPPAPSSSTATRVLEHL